MRRTFYISGARHWHGVVKPTTSNTPDDIPGHAPRVHPAFRSFVEEANKTQTDWSRPVANLRDEFHRWFERDRGGPRIIFQVLVDPEVDTALLWHSV